MEALRREDSWRRHPWNLHAAALSCWDVRSPPVELIALCPVPRDPPISPYLNLQLTPPPPFLQVNYDHFTPGVCDSESHYSRQLPRSFR